MSDLATGYYKIGKKCRYVLQKLLKLCIQNSMKS